MEKLHSLKLLCITTPDGLVSVCAGPFRGAVHDSTAAAISGLYTDLAHLAQDVPIDDSTPWRYVVYGDPAFTVNVGLLKGFPDTKATRTQRVFNAQMSRLRIISEWANK